MVNSVSTFQMAKDTIYQSCHDQVAEVAVQLFISNDKPNCSGLILAGSADFKTELSQSDMFDSRLQVSDDELFWGVHNKTFSFPGQDHQTCRHLLWRRKRIQPGLKTHGQIFRCFHRHLSSHNCKHFRPLSWQPSPLPTLSLSRRKSWLEGYWKFSLMNVQ